MNVFNSLQDYCKALAEWQNIPATITPDGIFVEGLYLSEWLKRNPKPVYSPEIPENPDGRSLNVGTITRK